MQSKEKPYVLYVAEIIYSEVYKIKNKNSEFSNIDAIESFIGSETYKKISSGKFHDEWFDNLYYAKSHFPLEISQRAFDHLWRMCENYELWCKETNQKKLILLNLID